MIDRKPLAPNNRNGIMRSEFLQSLESVATVVSYPKSQEEPRIKVYKTAGRQNNEGFGGGNRVTRYGQ